jgi:hypothetical protein
VWQPSANWANDLFYAESSFDRTFILVYFACIHAEEFSLLQKFMLVTDQFMRLWPMYSVIEFVDTAGIEVLATGYNDHDRLVHYGPDNCPSVAKAVI